MHSESRAQEMKLRSRYGNQPFLSQEKHQSVQSQKCELLSSNAAILLAENVRDTSFL